MATRSFRPFYCDEYSKKTKIKKKLNPQQQTGPKHLFLQSRNTLEQKVVSITTHQGSENQN